MNRIRGVILDFDDTLCLTEAACFKLENEVLNAMGRQSMPRDIHKKTWGQPLFTAIQERSPGVDADIFRELFAEKFENTVKAGELDAIPESNIVALDKLLDDGYTLLVLTSRERVEMEHILAPTHELAGRIEAFYYKDNMEFHKPDPRAFQHIEHEHGWKPDECVYIGDSPGDAAAAKQAGLHFIASLESGLRTEDDFQNLPVDKFINHFCEVVDAVRSLES